MDEALNIIKLTNVSYSRVKDSIREWIKQTNKHLNDGTWIHLYHINQRVQVIIVDERISSSHFFNLYKYLLYIKPIISSFQVEAYTLGKKNPEVKGKYLYINSRFNKKNRELIYFITPENVKYKTDLKKVFVKLDEECQYIHPDKYNLQNPEIFTSYKHIEIYSFYGNKYFKLKNRFASYTFLLLLAFILNSINFTSKSSYIEINSYIYLASIGYLSVDYKLLRSTRYYFYSLIFSLFIILYDTIGQIILNENSNMLIYNTFCFLTLIYLLWQFILRHTFILVFKHDPVIEKPAPSGKDFIYTVLIFMVPVYILGKMKFIHL